MSKNIEMNIKNSDTSYEPLYPKSLDDNIFLSEDIISALNLSENATLRDALSKNGSTGVYLKNYEYPVYIERNINLNSLTLGNTFSVPTEGTISSNRGVSVKNLLDCRILQENGENWLVGISSLTVVTNFYMNRSGGTSNYTNNSLDVHNTYEKAIENYIKEDFRNLIVNDSIQVIGENNGSLIDYIPPYKIFLLSSYEMNFDTAHGSTSIRPLNEGNKIEEDQLQYLDDKLNANSGAVLVSRSYSKSNSSGYVYCYERNIDSSLANNSSKLAEAFLPYAFWIPKNTVYKYYIDNDGNIHDSQLYDTYPVLCDSKGNITNSIYFGYYIGTGTNADLTITCEFPIKLLILANAPYSYYQNVPIYHIINPYTQEFQKQGNSGSVGLSWSTDKKSVTLTNWNLNTNGSRYMFIALG